MTWENVGVGGLHHPDRRFEWGRQEFQTWAEAVGGRFGDKARFPPLGPVGETLGPPTQMGCSIMADSQAACEFPHPRDDPRSVGELISAILSGPDEDPAWDAIGALHWRGTHEVLDRAVRLCRSPCAVERGWGRTSSDNSVSPIVASPSRASAPS